LTKENKRPNGNDDDDLKWRKRLEQEMDLAGRSPVRVIYPNTPKCPHCGDSLGIRQIKPHWFPYIHVDVSMACEMEDTEYLFGIPMSRDAGLALHIWDTNPLEALKKFIGMGNRACKFRGHGNMIPTKIFGDWFVDPKWDSELKVQWKCPVCFLVCQEWVKRDFPHADVDPLTDEEKAGLEEKLRSLGYI
tara:strand:- start:190 stop:759 length:570 start_codon:yes stop_codon:yes gene_type:complete